MSIPLFVVHNVHVYVGIPSYLRETFETHKVGLSLPLSCVCVRACVCACVCVSMMDGL